MAPGRTINLLYTQADRSPALATIEQHIQQVSYWLVSGVLLVGLVAGGVYLYLLGVVKSQEAARDRVAQAVDAQKDKEGLFLSIKERSKIVGRVTGAQKPWAKVVDIAGSFIPPEYISYLTVSEETNKVILSLVLPSFDRVYPFIDAVAAGVGVGAVRQVELTSFAMGKTDAVELTISFVPSF